METTNRRYRVELTDGAKKDLKKLCQHRKQIGEALGQLEENPLAGHTLQGTLYRLRSLEFTARGMAPFELSMACSKRTPSASSLLLGRTKISTTPFSHTPLHHA